MIRKCWQALTCCEHETVGVTATGCFPFSICCAEVGHRDGRRIMVQNVWWNHSTQSLFDPTRRQHISGWNIQKTHLSERWWIEMRTCKDSDNSKEISLLWNICILVTRHGDDSRYQCLGYRRPTTWTEATNWIDSPLLSADLALSFYIVLIGHAIEFSIIISRWKSDRKETEIALDLVCWSDWMDKLISKCVLAISNHGGGKNWFGAI